MTIIALIGRELRHRFFSFTLGLLAIVAAVALFVSILTMGRASNTETTRLMRNLGFNILVLPHDTDLSNYWLADFTQRYMPQEYVTRLANTGGILADHYVAVLQERITWRDKQVVLTGLLPEEVAIDALGRGKAPMGYKIEDGTCYVGYAVAKPLGIKQGDTIEIEGHPFVVQRTLVEDGSIEDSRIYAPLPAVQKILNLPGKINAIQALECLCEGADIGRLKEQIVSVLPQTTVVEMRTIATARADTRKMVAQHFSFIMSAVLVVCVAWVAGLTLLNVRDRRHEIGLMRALGFGSAHIAGLFLGRAVLMGVIGALLGFGIGTALALHYGPDIFTLTSKKIAPAFDLLTRALIAAPLVTALAAFLPSMVAVTQDPAAILTEE